jgi:NAD-dependent deacetylase
MNSKEIERTIQLMESSKKTIVLTGAGISTESGIPDFRSPGTGLWEKIDPMQALSTSILLNNPKQFYEFGFKMLTSMVDAQPNTSHYILSELESQGYISTIITQNIDNLHQKAGSKNVLEVHGHIRTGYCMNCRRETDLIKMQEKIDSGIIPPKCDYCSSGILRPSVVMFGDQLPPCFDLAWNEAENCDLLIVIGSSLEVGPVNYLAQICKKLVIINMGSTAYDHRAEVILNGKASEILTALHKGLVKN